MHFKVVDIRVASHEACLRQSSRSCASSAARPGQSDESIRERRNSCGKGTPASTCRSRVRLRPAGPRRQRIRQKQGFVHFPSPGPHRTSSLSLEPLKFLGGEFPDRQAGSSLVRTGENRRALREHRRRALNNSGVRRAVLDTAGQSDETKAPPFQWLQDLRRFDCFPRGVSKECPISPQTFLCVSRSTRRRRGSLSSLVHPAALRGHANALRAVITTLPWGGRSPGTRPPQHTAGDKRLITLQTQVVGVEWWSSGITARKETLRTPDLPY